MKTKLTLENYDFSVGGNQLIVQYLDLNRDKDIIIISNLDIELIGISESSDSDWNVVIVTKSGIKKLQNQIVDKLPAIGFKFKDLQTALEVQSFILYWILKIKKEKEEG